MKKFSPNSSIFQMGKGSSGEKKPRIKWDEETIAEHDKLRGTRQKIDEPPTPFRYGSESDQSECESSSDADSLKHSKEGIMHTNSSDFEDSHGDHRSPLGLIGEELDHNTHQKHPRFAESVSSSSSSNSQRKYQNNENYSPRHHYRDRKKKTSSSSFSSSLGKNSKSDALENNWESINAMLIYEKHLQDTRIQSSEEVLSRDDASGGGMEVVEDEVESNLLPLPQVSPRSQHRFKFNNSPGGSYSPSYSNRKYANHLFSNPPKKSVLVRGTSYETELGRAEGMSGNGHPGHSLGSPSQGDHNGNSDLFAGINGSIGGDDNREQKKRKEEQFKNKRASHYNEFKVLQAVRAQMAMEEDDEEEEDDQDNQGACT